MSMLPTALVAASCIISGYTPAAPDSSAASAPSGRFFSTGSPGAVPSALPPMESRTTTCASSTGSSYDPAFSRGTMLIVK